MDYCFFEIMTKVFKNLTDNFIKKMKIKLLEPMEGGVVVRIEAYNQVLQVYQSQKVNKSQKLTKATPVDQLQISSRGRDYQIAKAAVQASPDVREELTAPIKERVQNGTYAVETASFAEKLLQKYEEMR